MLHRQIGQGIPGATEKLYNLVTRVAYKPTRRAASWGADPDDLLHDIFVSVYRAVHGGSVRQPERLAGYILSTAQKQVSESLRRHVRHPMDALDESHRFANRGPDPEKIVAMRELRQRVEVLLGTLPKIDQAILRGFYYREMPWRTIAAELKLSPTQFRLRKYRALARIRCLAEAGGKAA